MTDPEDRYADMWEHVRHLEARVESLETWRSVRSALSVWWRWVVPVIVLAMGSVLTLINYPHLWHH